MSDKEEQNSVVVETMADSEEKPQKSQQDDDINKKFQKMGISFSIWPPTQRTRDAVITRLIETLSTPSVLSKRYGSMNADEASSTARVIEEEAFSTATSASASSGDNGSSTTAEDDGIEILQIYSKEISKRMLEAVKAKAATASENDSQNPVGAAPAATSEEISSAES